MNKKTILKVIAYEVVGMAALAALVVLYLFISSWVRYLAPTWASLFVAQYAHIQAGEKIPFPDDTLFTRSTPLERWTQQTNSEWLADYTRLIIPFFAYEELVSRPWYPVAVLFIPESGARSFHIGGTNHLAQGVITLNERYILDKKWDDQRDVLSVLIHELIHSQGGNFTFVLGLGPEEFEANTTTATVEVLAAMCNYGDQLACKAFWYEVESLARTRLMMQFKDLGFNDDVYQRVADFLWRDDTQEASARKARRYWANNQDEYWYIIRAYQANPYFLFVKGLGGGKLDTGNWATEPEGRRHVLGTPFDDSLDLIPDWIERLIALSAKGKK